VLGIPTEPVKDKLGNIKNLQCLGQVWSS